MRGPYNLLFCFGLCIFLISCGSKNSADYFSIQLKDDNNVFQKNETLSISLKNKKNKTVDSVGYFYGGKQVASALTDGKTTFQLKQPLGKNKLTAKIYTDGDVSEVSKEMVLHNDKAPKLYGYKIINTYPHDANAFTQGLEFHNDTLYEGTGLHGRSSLRKLDLKTGKVLEQINLENKYFGEGISILNNKIYQLTWQKGEGFIYDVKNFKKIGSFNYSQSKEGWGLCNDGKNLYKSDGTAKIWVLDPETLEEQRYIQPVTQKSLSTRLNELEWVEGKIYANTWQKDGIAIINPKTGAIEGLIDFRGLRDKVDNQNKDVLNGIAYNPDTKKLYVTGKNWDKLFEIEVFEK